MTLLDISRIVVLGAVGVIIAWDIFAQLRGGSKSTVSWAVWGFVQKAPWLSFIVGFVCGHLFWGDPQIMIQPPMLKARTVTGDQWAGGAWGTWDSWKGLYPDMTDVQAKRLGEIVCRFACTDIENPRRGFVGIDEKGEHWCLCTGAIDHVYRIEGKN